MRFIRVERWHLWEPLTTQFVFLENVRAKIRSFRKNI